MSLTSSFFLSFYFLHSNHHPSHFFFNRPYFSIFIKTPNNQLMAVMYSTYSALFGSTSVVFAKLLAVFVSLMTEGEAGTVFTSWFFYVTLVAWLVLMAYWLVRLNGALALYDPLFIIPLLQANFIFFAIISGGIYFQEFNYMTGSMWGGFVSGIAVIFIGLYFLAPEETEGGPPPPDEEDSYKPMLRASEVEMEDIYSKKNKGNVCLFVVVV
jgi:hypothetical protein